MNILLIEDEPMAAERLAKMILNLVPNATLSGPLDTVEDSLAWLKGHPQPDAVFLDVELADGKSFSILEEHPLSCPVVFCTAYDQYALDAFRHHGQAYLLKPVKEEELKDAVNRLLKKPELPGIDYGKLAEAVEVRQNQFQKRLLVKIGQRFKAVETSDIAYAFTRDKSVLVMTAAGKEIPVDHTLEQLERILDPRRFFRINRKLIVQVSAIDHMYAWSRSRVKLELKPAGDLDSIVATDRATAFKDWLEKGRQD